MDFLAALWLVNAAWALLRGEAAWWRGRVSRRTEPLRYWAVVGISLVMAWLFHSLGPVR